MESSFFACFDYSHLYMDGGDKTINMDGVVITRDIPELGLVKGTEYETCWWNVELGVLHFINWESAWKNEEMIPNKKTSLEVGQLSLARYLVWYDKDLPQ